MRAEDRKAVRLDAAHDRDRAIAEQHLSGGHPGPVEAK
jgi:hypothetical protein